MMHVYVVSLEGTFNLESICLVLSIASGQTWRKLPHLGCSTLCQIVLSTKQSNLVAKNCIIVISKFKDKCTGSHTDFHVLLSQSLLGLESLWKHTLPSLVSMQTDSWGLHRGCQLNAFTMASSPSRIPHSMVARFQERASYKGRVEAALTPVTSLRTESPSIMDS